MNASQNSEIPTLSNEFANKFDKIVLQGLKKTLDDVLAALLNNAEGPSEDYIIDLYNRPNNFFNNFWKSLQTFYKILKNATNNYMLNFEGRLNNNDLVRARLDENMLITTKNTLERLEELMKKIQRIILEKKQVNLVIDTGSIVTSGGKKYKRSTHKKRRSNNRKRSVRKKNNKNRKYK